MVNESPHPQGTQDIVAQRVSMAKPEVERSTQSASSRVKFGENQTVWVDCDQPPSPLSSEITSPVKTQLWGEDPSSSVARTNFPPGTQASMVPPQSIPPMVQGHPNDVSAPLNSFSSMQVVAGIYGSEATSQWHGELHGSQVTRGYAMESTPSLVMQNQVMAPPHAMSYGPTQHPLHVGHHALPNQVGQWGGDPNILDFSRFVLKVLFPPRQGKFREIKCMCNCRHYHPQRKMIR